MIIAGNIVSALGLILSLIGCGDWVWFWFATQKNRFAVIRSKSL